MLKNSMASTMLPRSKRPVSQLIIDRLSIWYGLGFLLVWILFLGRPTPVAAQDQQTLQGTVTDASDGSPLVGATVFVENQETGATTDKEGRYEIRVPSGTYTVAFDFVGYRQETRTVEVVSKTTLDVELQPERVSLQGVVVTGQTQDNIRALNTGIAELEVAQLERLPTFMGSPDIVRGLLERPGVSSVSEGAAGFNVRGGNVGQNLVLFNGTPVYFPSHLLGLFDPFNSDAVSNATLHKSSIPPEYGGRISSVLRVEQKVGDRESFHLRGGASPITSRLFVEGPIVEDKTSFAAAGRLSYVNWLLNLSGDSDLQNSEASFFDVNLGVNHRFGPADELDLVGYRAFDDFVLSDTTFTYATTNSALTWEHLINDRVHLEIEGFLGQYDFTIRDSDPVNAFELDSHVRTLGGRADLTWNLRNKHTLSLGVATKYHDINPGGIQPDDPVSQITPLQVQRQYGLESALYLSDKVMLTDALAVEGGLRLSLFNRFGPIQSPVFEDGQPQEPETIVDSVTTGRGEIGVTYVGLEPRFSLRYAFSNTRSVKFSYDRTYQYLHLLSNSTAVAPTDIWNLSNRQRKPQVGDQISAGYFQDFEEGAISVSAEVFFKWIRAVPEFKPGTEPLLNTSLSTDLLSGRGRAYGIEARAEKTQGQYTGQISYTYSRSLRRVTGSTPAERINGGEWFPADHDRPHELTTRFTYTGDDPRVQWNFKFVYRTGRAITFPSSKFEINGIPVANVQGRNQARVPDFHRLDLSLRIDLEQRGNRGWNGSWTFSVFNVYGRNNISSVFFDRDENGAPQAFSRSVLGAIFPSLTYTFEY